MKEIPNVHGLVPAAQRDRLCEELENADQQVFFAPFTGPVRGRLTEIAARVELQLPILGRILAESRLCLRLSSFMPARHGGLFSGGMVKRVPVFSRLGMSIHEFVQRYVGRVSAGQGPGRIRRMSTAEFREMDQCCSELNRSGLHDIVDSTRTVGSVCARVFLGACDLAYRVIEWDRTLIRESVPHAPMVGLGSFRCYWDVVPEHVLDFIARFNAPYIVRHGSGPAS